MLRFLLSAAFVLSLSAAQAATYYVSKSGNDSTGNGSSGNPWLTIQKAANTAVAGDTVIVRAGIYSDQSGTINVNLGTTGTAGNPITFKSEVKWGAVIDGTSSSFAFYFGNNVSYITIQDFDITGQHSISASGAGAFWLNFGTQTGVIITGNRVHDIGVTCASTTLGQAGVYANTAVNLTITNNIFENIGRYGPTENAACWPAYVGGTSYASGAQVSQGGAYYRATAACNTCASTPPAAPWAVDSGYTNLDHALYISNVTTGTFKGNIFAHLLHGWGIQFYGGAVSGLTVSNNVFTGQNVYTWQSGAIVVAQNLTNTTFEGNIIAGPNGDLMFYYGSSGTMTNVVVRNNALWPSTVTVGTAPTGLTTSGNLNVDPGTMLPATMVR